MQTITATSFVDLSTELTNLRAALPAPLQTIKGIHPPIPLIPIHLPVITTLMRGTTVIGHVITPSGAPVPTAANVALASGTLWIEATLLGAPFASTAGFAGIPFASASMTVSGPVTFGGGEIVLDTTATLTFSVASATTPATGPAGDPIGPDFLAAKLTPFAHATITLAPAGATIVLSGTGAASLYGQSISLTPAASPTLAELNFTTPHAAISCNCAQSTFTVAQSTSPEVVIAGKAPIVGAGVVFPILTAATPNALPAPGDAWGIVVVTGSGLSATIAPLTAALMLGGASFALTPARLVGLVANGAGRAQESYLLWAVPAQPSPVPPTQPPLARPPSQVTLDLGPGALVSFSAAPDQETSIAAGTLNALLDRPVDSGGQRIVLQGPALFVRVHTATSITVDVGSVLTPTAKTSLALIAENALIPVGTPNGFLLSGTLSQGQISGGLSIGFPAGVIIPTFPDPYAASYAASAGRELLAGVAALVTWTATTPPVLTINPIKTSSLAPTPATIGSATTSLLPVATAGTGFRLLDVSSNADQWGIAIGVLGGSQFSFAGLQLQAPAAATAVFTVPGISWEPVVDTTGVPAWLAAFSPDDGIPTTFLVAVTAPTPIVPVLALEQYQAGAGKLPTQAAFTLPFGITANLSEPTPASPGPSYAVPSVEFPDEGLTGARVLSITGPQGTLPGTAITGFSATPPAYGAQVLGTALPSVAKFWDEDFGPGGRGFMPVARIDLSGYGTTLFSDWLDPVPTDPGIIRALFNVLLGRTAHEIITAQTWILPWCIRLQRTITFDRSDAGKVVKHDTGWQAVGPGIFELLAPNGLLAGAVESLKNVRNIQFSKSVVTVGSIQYTPCTFEADVEFFPAIHITADGQTNIHISSGTAIQGYAQDTITSSDPAKLSPAPPTAADIFALMQQQGRVSGTTHCIASLGGTGPQQFTMNVSSFGAALAAGTTAKLQTALFGTPRLPKDGQWSVAKRSSAANTPQPVDSQTPVPLTRGTSAGTSVPTNAGTFAADSFRLLDPEDAQRVDTPNTFYSIMQGTGTSKTLYEHPLINDAGDGIGFNKLPGFADVGALLGVASIFPDIGSALQIPSTDGLPLKGDGFTRTYTWGPGASPPTAAPPDRAVLDIAIVHLVLSYSKFKGTLTLDASTTPTNWSLTLENLAFIGNVDGFGTLLTITGGFQAGSTISPGFTNLNVVYGPSLDPIQAILTGLSGIAKSLGGDAELDVGFSGNTLTVQQGFTLPTIPLGFGEITDLGLDLGFSATIPSDLSFSVGIGSKQDPFQWVVSPLAGTGAIVLGVQGGGLDVYLEAGLGLGLSISVAVASGSASIVVSLSLDIGTTQIQIAAALTGNAQVDVLGGLASASLTLTAAIVITLPAPLPPSEADLSAQVSVGIHISICWVINVSFDGSWGFSETISI
ncbi:hypothetical protein UP10_15570 [Bradyrhizobium sp. LTSPM299]|uniref:hypothetical protein n=1 Tax=Bradyrhizobium sp. LTSPM299 TaxID=1619233 RepID=UPI0005C97995|nr:hypothetical protein [Bradyrhizobium sp. LTSPM299]KJC60081.1 hypothetical protein UP10_15570 [Bradyrhizobium sp. LTSPM299]